MAVSRWIFTKEQILNTPSRKHGIDSDKELSYRQQAANLIQDMGQRLSVSQLCINTAIVYMHRFYMFQSFGRFPRNDMAPACLFLAAKVEEQPRKLEHVIRVAHACLHRDNTTAPDPQTEAYLEQAQIIVMNENILLQTLGFETSVDHPHSKVVETTTLVKASKDLSQTSYFLATNSLHLTTFCLQYRPSIVACVCIYLASKWSNWKITRSNQGKEWYYYVDPTATQDLLEDLCTEFLNIMDRGPNKLKKKIMGWKAGHREIYRSEEEKQAELRKQRSEQLQSTSANTSQASASNLQHRHTNHDRKREHDDRRDHSDRREMHHHERKEIGPNGDAHPLTQPKRETHGERRDIPERREERKDMNDRRNAEIKGVHERRDHGEKRDSMERKVSDIKKENSVGKDQEGKINMHKKDGERKEFIPGKDPHKPKHERNFLDAVIGKDITDSHGSVRDKQESKTFQGERNDSGVHISGHIPRTSQAIQNVKLENLKSETLNVKTESHASDQTSAKPEFVVPKLEKLETHPHSKEPHNSLASSSNAAPKKVPVSLNLSPAVESLQSGLHKSKSEMTLNYKDYLQRKERERQQLLEKQEKFNLNRSFTEGSQSSSKTNKQPNLDTSLPLKLQGNSEMVKEEIGTESRHDIHMKTGHEKEGRLKSDHETKMHHVADVKPRKRSNSKSPGASKRSPRVHKSNSTKVSPVKMLTDQSKGQGHMKSNRMETPHLKLHISNNSENPPSPLKSPVKNLKEIPKSEPFVDLGEPLKTDGKKRRFSGPEIEKLTGIELENLRMKTETVQPESVNLSIPKESLKPSSGLPVSVTCDNKDIIRDGAKVAVKQEPAETSATRDSPNKFNKEPNEAAKLNPLVQNKHLFNDVTAAMHSPLLHDKHTPKDASVAKHNPVLYNKHPPKDINNALQSPLPHSRHPPKDLNVKQSPLVTGKHDHTKESDRTKHSPMVPKKDFKDSIAKQSPVVTVQQEKHSPVIPKKDFKDASITKQSHVVTVQQENRDSNSARQSPLTVAMPDLKESNTSKQSPRVILKPESKDSNTSKQSPRVVIKQEFTENNIDEPDIQLKPEHSGLQPLKLHIKEPVAHDSMASKSFTPDVSTIKTASPIPSLKISIKKEPGSGGNTPVKYKTEHSNGSTPLKLTIKQEPSSDSPLKMKLKASHSGDHGEKHHRRHKEGHVHSGKHKHKHKSHKHKDRDKDRERKHSKHSMEVTGSNGKQEIKIRMKLGQPPSTEGSSSSTSQSGTYHISKRDKHKGREGANVLPEIVSDKDVSLDEPERHQPWSLSELDPKSAARQAAKKVADSPSRKRRRAPTVDDGSDVSMLQPHQKAAKTNSNRLRRSSSSHSVVSMEMSDNECGEDPNKANEDQLKALQIKLKQAIQFQKKVIDDRLKEQKVVGKKPVQPNYERQKSGFDIDLYCGDSVGTPPPLPQGHPPLPPTPPSSQLLGTPPPPPPTT